MPKIVPLRLWTDPNALPVAHRELFASIWKVFPKVSEEELLDVLHILQHLNEEASLE